jgi:hypothetical protein
MNDKLTPRQNEIISEALAQIATKAAEQGRDKDLPERIKTIRRALVNELEAVTAETTRYPFSSDAPSISG